MRISSEFEITGETVFTGSSIGGGAFLTPTTFERKVDAAGAEDMTCFGNMMDKCLKELRPGGTLTRLRSDSEKTPPVDDEEKAPVRDKASTQKDFLMGNEGKMENHEAGVAGAEEGFSRGVHADSQGSPQGMVNMSEGERIKTRLRFPHVGSSLSERKMLEEDAYKPDSFLKNDGMAFAHQEEGITSEFQKMDEKVISMSMKVSDEKCLSDKICEDLFKTGLSRSEPKNGHTLLPHLQGKIRPRSTKYGRKKNERSETASGLGKAFLNENNKKVESGVNRSRSSISKEDFVMPAKDGDMDKPSGDISGLEMKKAGKEDGIRLTEIPMKAFGPSTLETVPERNLPPETPRMLSMARRIADNFVTLISRKGGRVRVTLEPSRLGPLDMDVLVRGEKVRVILTTVNPETRSILESNIDFLRHSLGDRGFSGEGVDLSVEGQADGNGRETSGGENGHAQTEYFGRRPGNGVEGGNLSSGPDVPDTKREVSVLKDGLVSVFA